MTIYAQSVSESKGISDAVAAGNPGIVATSTRVNRLALNIVTMNWTPDVSGGLSGVAVELPDGWIQQVAFTPAVGAAAPNSGYKVTLLDGNGFDVFLALGNGTSGLSAAVIGCPLLSNSFEPTGGSPHPKIYIDGGNYQPTISGAGVQALGKIVVYIADTMS